MRLFVADRQKLHVWLNLRPQAVTPQNGAKSTDLKIDGLRRCARALPQLREVSTSGSRLRGHGACSSPRAQQAGRKNRGLHLTHVDVVQNIRSHGRRHEMGDHAVDRKGVGLLDIEAGAGNTT